jgi:hypothetical protein
MLSKLRLRYGMYWATHRPPMPWRHVAVLTLCALTYLGVSYVDNLHERVKQMEGDGAYAKVLFDCMSGASGFYFADTTEVFACDIYPLGKSNLRTNTRQDS